MQAALEEAQKAYDLKEVPIGAIVIKDGSIIGRGHNLKEMRKDSTAHAEIIALQQASAFLGNWRLSGCELYVTLEPCPMCAGAIQQARIERIFFGAYDEKAGCCGSLYNIPEDSRFNHQVEVIGGILEQQCSWILKDFFQHKRQK